MSTLRSASKVIETRYVWAPTVEGAMEQAGHMKQYGWLIEGNPAPMIYQGKYGTGVSISRVNYG